MQHTIVFDCEFLTAEGSPSRFWCGPHDPDPVVAQIGLVKVGLAAGFPILDTRRIHVLPRNRRGDPVTLDPFFTALTGITESLLQAEGVSLFDALQDTQTFAAEARLWSWGKDEFNMVAISCYVQGLIPPMPATQFGNACDLLLRAGMSYDDIKKTRSNQLAAHYGLTGPDLRAHDALDDARSVAFVLQHLLNSRSLQPGDFC